MGAPTELQQVEKTVEWANLDAAVAELARERALVEESEHAYIVEYLYRALSRPKPGVQATLSMEARLAGWARLRGTVHEANIGRRDLVQELFEERREEARLEDLGL